MKIEYSDAEYSIGIDPGWKNLGVAVVRREKGKVELVYASTFDPSSYGSVVKAGREIQAILWNKILDDVVSPGRHLKSGPKVHGVMERYVSYTDVTTAEAEKILMMIGAIAAESYGMLYETGAEYDMLRAIDWKKDLVKILFKKKGFSNPSDKLDKKFSIAAAKACLSTETEINTNHEADAICMACLPFLREA